MTKSSITALSNSIVPVHEIVEGGLAWRHSEADRARRAGRLEALASSAAVERAAGPVVYPAAAGGFRRLALLLQRLGRAIAVVRAPLRDEALRHLRGALETLRLKIRRVRSALVGAFIPIESQPAQTLDDARDHLPRGALGIGVFDAKDEGAAMAARVEPVEQRRPGAADVKIAGR